MSSPLPLLVHGCVYSLSGLGRFKLDFERSQTFATCQSHENLAKIYPTPRLQTASTSEELGTNNAAPVKCIPIARSIVAEHPG